MVEEMIGKLGEAEVAPAQGIAVLDVCRRLGERDGPSAPTFD